MTPETPPLARPVLDLLGRGEHDAAEQAIGAIARDTTAELAMVAIDAVQRRHPEWIPALDALGRTMLRMRQHQAMFNVGQRIAQVAPGDWRGPELQALAMEYGGARPEQVLPLRRRLAAMLPDSAPHQFLHAVTASRVGLYEEMHAALDATLRLNPDLLPARWAKFLTPRGKFFASRDAIERYVHDWDQGFGVFANRDLEAPALRHRLEGILLSQCNFHLAYTGIDVTSRQIALGDAIGRMARSAFPAFASVDAPPERVRRRIGFLTPTLRRHTVLKLFAGLMTRLPRDRFEVYAYALESGSDATTERLRAQVDVVRTEIASMTAMAERIRDDACDALVYLDIGMHPRSVAMAALRLAPFQAMLWGHPVTSGLATVDAYISSDAMEPVRAATHYREALLPLPGLGCWYDPTQLQAQPRARAPRDGDRVRLVCAQSGQKLLPEQDAVFARILAGDARSDLVLLTGLPAGIEFELVARMRPAFDAHGIDFDTRVRVVGQVDEPRFLAELWDADLVLDTLGWSGGVTALETFWGDVPVLAVAGEFMRSRHTAAMLRAMDLPELVADDADDFVARALRLCGDGEARERLRGAIAERKHRLYRDDDVVAAFARLLDARIALRA